MARDTHGRGLVAEWMRTAYALEAMRADKVLIVQEAAEQAQPCLVSYRI